ncbi:MAG TPA: heparan-alpha-glucosaminide N-acetyltransferase domain-containing protein, partial [Chryseolinea sp.]
SGLIFLPRKAIFFIAIVMIAAHNLLDGISFQDGTLTDVVWSFLHVQKSFDLGNNYSFGTLYPIIPWVGVMALGYCFGYFYNSDYSSANRKTVLSQSGIVCLIIFFTLRTSNVYGDPGPWTKYKEIDDTVISFFNLEKYPPSFLFLSVTLGISLLLLAIMEGKSLQTLRPAKHFGNVALFYYITHIFLIHLFATFAAIVTGFSWKSMIFIGSPGKGSAMLNGHYGFELWVVYLIWIAVVLVLFPLCVYWKNFKIRNKEKWWISYV